MPQIVFDLFCLLGLRLLVSVSESDRFRHPKKEIAIPTKAFVWRKSTIWRPPAAVPGPTPAPQQQPTGGSTSVPCRADGQHDVVCARRNWAAGTTAHTPIPTEFGADAGKQ